MDCPVCHAENPSIAKHCLECGSLLAGRESGSFEQPPADLLTMEKLGRAFAGKYRIERKLGSGGMGDVFEGRHQALGSSVAIKILSAPLNRDPDLVRRFFREARAAAGLKHPNIINIQDVGQFEDLHYMVMDFVSGQDLKSLISLNPNIDPLRAIDIISQVTRALSYAHSRGIVHRDIKPANIMIDQHGTAVVMDFGIAKVGDATSQLTQEGLLIGTPYYMSPEQCRGESVTNQSDLYSLGVVFYQLLASRVPFEGHDSLSIIYQKINTTPIPIGELRRDLPEELGPIVHRMLERDAADRYLNADQLLADLEQLKADLKARRSRVGPETVVPFGSNASELERTTPLPGMIPPLSNSGTAQTRIPIPTGTTRPDAGSAARTEHATGFPAPAGPHVPTLVQTQRDDPSKAAGESRSPGRLVFAVLTLLLVAGAALAWWYFQGSKVPTPATPGSGSASSMPDSGGGRIASPPPAGMEPGQSQSVATPEPGAPPPKPPPTISRPPVAKRIEPFSVTAKHRHGIGNCEGRLTIAGEQVSYQPNEGNKDAFTRPYRQLRFSAGGTRLSLKFPDRKYDFDLPSASLLDEAYAKLKQFSTKPMEVHKP